MIESNSVSLGVTCSAQRATKRCSTGSVLGGPSGDAGMLAFGADLYAVYKPGSSTNLPIASDLQFIQVAYDCCVGGASSFVDSARHNPFYGEGGGLTSIDGNQTVSFYDHMIDIAASPGASVARAETFLARDTGRKGRSGKEIVAIYGGVKWGFALTASPAASTARAAPWPGMPLTPPPRRAPAPASHTFAAAVSTPQRPTSESVSANGHARSR